MQRNDVSEVHAGDTGKTCSRHWKVMLIGPGTIGKGVGEKERLYFPSLFPPHEQYLPVRF